MNILEQNDPAHFMKEHWKYSVHLEFGGRNVPAAQELQLLRSDVQNHLTAPLAGGILHSETLWEG